MCSGCQPISIRPDIPVLIDEAYVDFGGESAVPLIADHPNLLVVLCEHSGDLDARQCHAGRSVGIGDHDRPRRAPIILDPEAHSFVERHGLAGEAEQLPPYRIEAVGDVRKQERLRLFQESNKRMREHFVRTVADENLFGLHTVMGGKRFAQRRRLGIGIEPQAVDRGGSHRFQRERRRAERALVGVELHQIGDARLLAGYIGRKLTRDLAPERVHRGVRVGSSDGLTSQDRLRQLGSPCCARCRQLALPTMRAISDVIAQRDRRPERGAVTSSSIWCQFLVRNADTARRVSRGRTRNSPPCRRWRARRGSPATTRISIDLTPQGSTSTKCAASFLPLAMILSETRLWQELPASPRPPR
jgi:hypothetical protein